MLNIYDAFDINIDLIELNVTFIDNDFKTIFL